MTTRNAPKLPPAAPPPAPPVDLSPEQGAKYAELIKMLDEWVAEGERMTPEEKARADADWELFKRTINEPRQGYRLIYVD